MLFTKAGPSFQEAMYYYSALIIETEEIPKKYDIKKLFLNMEKKGSLLDQNRIRYKHSKEWDACLIYTIFTEYMKPVITKHCPNILGGNPGFFSGGQCTTKYIG